MTLKATSFSSEDLASQLTLIDLQLFKAICPDELTSCGWNKKNKVHVAPNIVGLTRRFNHVSFWVVEEVLGPETAKERVEVLAHFIHVAKRLHDLNNLHTEHAVVSALQSAPIYRLHKTWSHLPRREKQTLDRLSELFSEENNFSALRNYLDDLALARHCECIPYLGLYLTDMIYIDMAHPHSGGMESHQRKIKMNNILRIVSEFQQSNYSALLPLPKCQEYLRSLKYIDELQKFLEDNQWKRSLAVEPDASKQRSSDAEPVGIMAHLNLSPVKGAQGSSSHFIPGHRKTKSDGNMIFASLTGPPDKYRHHLLDDSMIIDQDKEQHSAMSMSKKSATAPRPKSSKRLPDDPGVKCQYQGAIKRKVLIKGGNKPFVTTWNRFWMELWDDSLVLYSPRAMMTGGRSGPSKIAAREDFKKDPSKFFTIRGWKVFVDKESINNDCSFQLTDPSRLDVVRFKADSMKETNAWVMHLHDALERKKQQLQAKNLISFE